MLRTEGQPRPTWLVYAKKKLWEEDDALTPDREKIAEAWARIFGDELDLKKAIARHDDGDAVYYLFRCGEVACSAFDVEAIYETSPELARALWPST